MTRLHIHQELKAEPHTGPLVLVTAPEHRLLARAEPIAFPLLGVVLLAWFCTLGVLWLRYRRSEQPWYGLFTRPPLSLPFERELFRSEGESLRRRVATGTVVACVLAVAILLTLLLLQFTA